LLRPEPAWPAHSFSRALQSAAAAAADLPDASHNASPNASHLTANNAPAHKKLLGWTP